MVGINYLKDSTETMDKCKSIWLKTQRCSRWCEFDIPKTAPSEHHETLSLQRVQHFPHILGCFPSWNHFSVSWRATLHIFVTCNSISNDAYNFTNTFCKAIEKNYHEISLKLAPKSNKSRRNNMLLTYKLPNTSPAPCNKTNSKKWQKKGRCFH